jgi:hypothetical protein
MRRSSMLMYFVYCHFNDHIRNNEDINGEDIMRQIRENIKKRRETPPLQKKWKR